MLGTKTMIVLSSAEAVRDLLDQRSAIYSSRPDFYVGNVASDSLRVLLMPYGKEWRGIHRVFHSILNVRAAKAYVPYQDLENKQMLVGILDNPAEYRSHIRRFTFSLTMQMVYGTRASRIDDQKLKALFSNVARFEELIGAVSSQLLDLFPVLRHIPDTLLPLRRKAVELRRDESELFGGFWHDAKDKIQRGVAQVCVSARLVTKLVTMARILTTFRTSRACATTSSRPREPKRCQTLWLPTRQALYSRLARTPRPIP
jgi:hypothetical protein